MHLNKNECEGDCIYIQAFIALLSWVTSYISWCSSDFL